MTLFFKLIFHVEEMLTKLTGLMTLETRITEPGNNSLQAGRASGRAWFGVPGSMSLLKCSCLSPRFHCTNCHGGPRKGDGHTRSHLKTTLLKVLALRGENSNNFRPNPLSLPSSCLAACF